VEVNKYMLQVSMLRDLEQIFSWCTVLYSVATRLGADGLVVYGIVLSNHKTWSIWSRGARCCTQYATRLVADGLVVQGLLGMPRDLEQMV
jgi:hypothetical protein